MHLRFKRLFWDTRSVSKQGETSVVFDQCLSKYMDNYFSIYWLDFTKVLNLLTSGFRVKIDDVFKNT